MSIVSLFHSFAPSPMSGMMFAEASDTFSDIWSSFVSGCVRIGWRLAAALLVLLIGTLLIRCLLRLLRTGKLAQRMDPMFHSFLLSFVKVSCYAILCIILVGILGVETASIITVLATGGAALALALQGSLSNLAGGLMLLVFRPFQVGDFIEVMDQSGTVKDVGIFYTVLVTPDNREVTVPNGSLISSVIVNFSREKNRRLDLCFRVPLDADTEKAKELIGQVIAGQDSVQESPAPFIRMTAVGDSSLEITVRVWCVNEVYWNLKFDLTEGIAHALEEGGIQVPHAQMDVHIKNDGASR